MDNNLFAVDPVSVVIKNFPKVVGVVAFHVYKVHFAIELQRFDALSIQSLFSGPGLFKHDQRSTRHGAAIVVQECTASCKPIYEIELEFITNGVHAQRVEIRTKVSAQDIELRLAVLLDFWRRVVRMPVEGQGLSPLVGKPERRYVLFHRVTVRLLSASGRPTA